MTEFTDGDAGWEPTAAELARMSELVSELREVDAQRSRLDARRARVLDEAMRIAACQMQRAADSAYEFPVRSAAAELAVAVAESPRSMQAQLNAAHELVTDFPATWRALDAGKISDKHARAIRDAGARLDDEADRRRYEREVFDAAGHGVAPGRLRKIAEQTAERIDPRSITDRHRLARGARRVIVTDLPDGMAELFAVLPAIVAHGIHDRLTTMAKAVRRDRRALRRGAAGDEPSAAVPEASDERTVDQLRADLCGDLLLTGSPTGHHLHADDAASIDHTVLAAIRATVQVTIPVTTLAGLDDTAALLDGAGPVNPATVRALAARAPGWDRVFVHPDTGALHAVDGYSPTAAQRRFLRARDGTCRFPGCATPARRSDLDHTRAHARGGGTEVTNLAHLCEPHHMVKHHTPWRVRQRGAGILEWTTPTGIHYTDAPLSVHFTASAGAPPF